MMETTNVLTEKNETIIKTVKDNLVYIPTKKAKEHYVERVRQQVWDIIDNEEEDLSYEERIKLDTLVWALIELQWTIKYYSLP